jgi:glycine cleavage system transcriptional repressor
MAILKSYSKTLPQEENDRMPEPQHSYVLDVMAEDHPGIVASVSQAVESLGGNIDSCSQTVLSGYFTLIMIVSLPEQVPPDVLAERVRTAEGARRPYQVLVHLKEPQPDSAVPEPTDRFVITAFGDDRPGIVRRFSQYLAGKDVNIVDLYGHREGDEFVLIGQVEVPTRWDVRMMQADLEELGQELGFAVKLQHENVFVATNQLRFTRLQ